MILIETISTSALLILLIVMATILLILSVWAIIDDDWESAPLPFIIFVILVVLIIAVCVDKTSYKIKITDDNITIKELTDTFIIENYDAKNDIWTVQQKDGGFNPADLNKKGE